MKPVHLLWLALFAAPFFVGLDDSSVWDANEAFYAQTPREMLERGDWTVPHFNGQPRLNKPPLSYWLVAVLYRLFGPDLFWERLAMALLATGSIGAVYRLGRTLFDGPTALLASGLWATTFRFVILSRRLLIDCLLIFCLLMALAFLVDWLRNRRRWTFLAGAAFMGLGFLAKGPLALFPGFLILAHLAAGRRLKRLSEAPWGWAILLMAAIGASWFVALGVKEGWQAPLNFFLRENLGRFAGLESFQRGWPNPPPRGVFYYCGVFLADFFPWSLFFLTALIGRVFDRSREGPPPERENRRLLWIWMAVWFVAFSFSQNKQEYYIVPLYPAAAIWTALQLRRRDWFLIPAGLAFATLAALALGLYWITGGLFPETSLLWLPLPFLVLSPALALKRRWLEAGGCLSLFLVFGFGVYLQPMEAYRPVRHFARTIAGLEAASSPAEAGYYGFTAPSLTFYLNRPIREMYRLDEAVRLLTGGERVYLIVGEADLAELRQAAPDSVRIIETRPALSINARTMLAALRTGRPLDVGEWTRPVSLITNRSP